jgi:hypothetical protein
LAGLAHVRTTEYGGPPVPLSTSSIVQSNVSSTGASAAAATVTVSLGSATTPGNTVIVGLATGTNMTTPAGWTLDVSTGTLVAVYRKGGSAYAGGETSWNFSTTAGTTTAAWFVLEVEGLDDDPLDATSTGTANGSPQTVGTIAQNSAFDCIGIAVHAGSSTTLPVGSMSGQTGGYTELGEAASTVGTARDVAVSTWFPGDVTAFASSATKTGNFNLGTLGVQVVYRAAGSPAYPSIVHHAGFEWGTDAGLNTGAVAAALFDQVTGTGAVGTNILVQSGSAKNGSYGLRLVASAIEVGIGLFGATGRSLTTGQTALTAGFWVRVVSSTGTVVLWTCRDLANNTLQLLYDTTNTRLGVRWVTGVAPGTPGTTTWQTGATASNTWTRVDICFYGCKGTTRDMLWSLDGVSQTAAAQLTGTAASTILGTVMGQWTSYGTQTVTADYDDWRLSTSKVDYPLGDQRIVLLKVDPAGTVTLSGTSTNFGVFSGATPTISAWNATTARANTDELPPGLGASADGVTQMLAAASDYMQFPMETYTLASGEVIVAVRALVAGWAAGTSAIGLRGYDGTTETVLWAAADPTWNNSSTAPGWLGKRWIILPRWTQAKLDAAALRLGFGTSATDIGAHALYLEVVIGAATSQQLFGGQATAGYDPGGNYAVVEVDVAPPVGGDASLYYEVNTSPTTVTVTQDTAHTETIDAPSAAAANYISLAFPPEGVPDA